MALLIPLKSTTQEAGIVELVEQIQDSQDAAILAGSSSPNVKIHEIVETYRTDMKSKTLTFTCTVRLDVITNTDGQSVIVPRVEYP